MGRRGTIPACLILCATGALHHMPQGRGCSRQGHGGPDMRTVTVGRALCVVKSACHTNIILLSLLYCPCHSELRETTWGVALDCCGIVSRPTKAMMTQLS